MTKMIYPSQRADQILPHVREYLNQGNLETFKKIKSLQKRLVKAKHDVPVLNMTIGQMRSARLYYKDSNDWLHDWDDEYTRIDGKHQKFMVVGLVGHQYVLGRSIKKLQFDIDSTSGKFYDGLYSYLRAKEFPTTATTRRAAHILFDRYDLMVA